MSENMSPLQRYTERLENGEFQQDDAQAQVVALLDDLFARIRARDAQPGGWRALLHKLPGVSAAPTAPEKGLYVWGGVGRGKTMLMDLFCESLSEGEYLRIHFHRFMRRVHQGLKKYSGRSNPLRQVAEDIAAEAQVLCFDEFFVSDIGDAMILAEMLQALFERQVALVATSNVEPSRLYENGLQRRRFLPAIYLICEHTLVHHIQDGLDFRLRALEQAEIYHFPLDDRAETQLTEYFAALAPGQAEHDTVLSVEGRDIPVRSVADDVVWFDFAALCEGPRSQNDYIELAMEYHAVLLSNVPVMDEKKEDAARRFISLVDEFYDHGVKLIISAAAGIADIYQGERLRFEFERTRSRLLEMQSQEYLGASHLVAAPGTA